MKRMVLNLKLKSNHSYIYMGIAAILLIKLVMLLFFPSPSIFADESVYVQIADKIIKRFDLVSNIYFAQNYPPLYPITISLPLLIGNMHISYLLIQIINILLNTSVVVFAYMLLRGLVENRHAVAASLTAGILPSVFPYTFNIMSENLYIPLLLLTVYLFYMLEKSDRKLYPFLLGVITAAMYLTRTIGLVHIIALFLTLAAAMILERDFVKNTRRGLYSLLGALLVVVPYHLIVALQAKALFVEDNAYDSTKYLQIILSWFKSPDAFRTFLRLVLSEIGFTMAACFVIFFIFALIFAYKTFKKKTNRLMIVYTALAFAGTMVLTVAHMYKIYTNGNMEYLVFARYLDPFIPVFMIFGFLGFIDFKNSRKVESPRSAALLLFCLLYPIVLLFLPITNYKFFNMYSIYYLSYYSSKYLGITVLLVFLPLMLSVLYLRKYRSILIVMIVFIILMNIPTIELQAAKSREYAGDFKAIDTIMQERDWDVIYFERAGHSELLYFVFKFWHPEREFRMTQMSEYKLQPHPNQLFISSVAYPFKTLYTNEKYTVYDLGQLEVRSN